MESTRVPDQETDLTPASASLEYDYDPTDEELATAGDEFPTGAFLIPGDDPIDEGEPETAVTTTINALTVPEQGDISFADDDDIYSVSIEKAVADMKAKREAENKPVPVIGDRSLFQMNEPKFSGSHTYGQPQTIADQINNLFIDLEQLILTNIRHPAHRRLASASVQQTLDLLLLLLNK